MVTYVTIFPPYLPSSPPLSLFPSYSTIIIIIAGSLNGDAVALGCFSHLLQPHLPQAGLGEKLGGAAKLHKEPVLLVDEERPFFLRGGDEEVPEGGIEREGSGLVDDEVVLAAILSGWYVGRRDDTWAEMVTTLIVARKNLQCCGELRKGVHLYVTTMKGKSGIFLIIMTTMFTWLV